MIGCGVNVWDPFGGALPLWRTIQDGTIALLYDAEFGVVGSPVTSWTPRIGGTASDVLITSLAGREPFYTAGDVDYGGRPSVSSNASKHLLSTTPATALVLAQPYYLITVQTTPTATVAYKNTTDGALVAGRAQLARNAVNNWTIRSSAWYDTGIACVDATPVLNTALFSGIASTFRSRNSNGVVSTAGPGSVGITSVNGISLFATYNWTGGADVSLTAVMLVTGLSAADQTRLDRWCQQKMGWA